MVEKFFDVTYAKAESFHKSLYRLRQKEAKQLKLRLKIFLAIYIPAIIIALVMVVNSFVSAAEKNNYDKGDSESTEETGSLIQDFVNATSQDGIYSYSAGSSVEYQSYTFPGMEGGTIEKADEKVPTDNWVKGMNEWLYETLYESVSGVKVESESGYADGPIGSLFQWFISTLITSYFGIFIIILRWIIVYPFMFIERALAVLGPNFYPASLFGLFLGRVGSGGQVTTNFFGFEFVEGNVYGIVGSILYGIITSICGIGIGAKFIGSLAGAAWNSGSSDSRKKLKDAITSGVGSVVLLSALPFFVYIICYIRDVILYEVLRVAEGLSNANLGGGTSVDTLGNSFTDLATCLIVASRVTEGSYVGRSYNPLLERALDFSNGTLMDSIMYAGSVALLLIFIFIYIALALDTTITFASGGVAVLMGKDNFMEWIRHMVANIMTPVVDMMVFMIPLIFGSIATSSAGSYSIVWLIELVLCFSYFPLRSSLRAKLGMRSAESSEGMGMGSMMMAMGAIRAMASGAGSLARNISSGVSNMETASTGAEMAGAEASIQSEELKDNINQLDNLDEAMKSADGLSSDESTNGTALPPGAEDLSGTGMPSDEPDSVSDEQGIDSDKTLLSGAQSEMDKLKQEDAELDGAEGSITTATIHTSTDTSATSKGTNATVGEGLTDQIAKGNVETAEHASRIANESAMKVSQHREFARQNDEKAKEIRAIAATAKAGGTLTDKQMAMYGDEKTAMAKALNYESEAMKHRNQAMRYSEIQKQAEAVCNSARRRMGIGGQGAFTSGELSAYNHIQQSANVGNFQDPMIARSLSPAQQQKFFLEARRKAGAEITTGIATTTALAGLVGSSTIFMPTAVKAGALGMVAHGGSAAMKAVSSVMAEHPTGTPNLQGVRSYDVGSGFNSGLYNTSIPEVEISTTVTGGGVGSPVEVANEGTAAYKPAIDMMFMPLEQRGELSSGYYTTPLGFAMTDIDSKPIQYALSVYTQKYMQRDSNGVAVGGAGMQYIDKCMNDSAFFQDVMQYGRGYRICHDNEFGNVSFMNDTASQKLFCDRLRVDLQQRHAMNEAEATAYMNELNIARQEICKTMKQEVLSKLGPSEISSGMAGTISRFIDANIGEAE